MSVAKFAQIANELVAVLKTSGFAEAEFRALPYWKREECTDRRCVVTLRNATYEAGTREDYDQQLELQVTLQKALLPSEHATFLALLLDVETLVRLWGEDGHLRDRRLADFHYSDGPEHPTGAIYEPLPLNEEHLFVSHVVVRYTLG